MLSDTSVQKMNAHRQPFENKSLEIVCVDCCYFFPLLLTKCIVTGLRYLLHDSNVLLL